VIFRQANASIAEGDGMMADFERAFGCMLPMKAPLGRV